MAGFKGFGYKSPEEIIAETQAGFQRALQSGNKDAMRAAIAQQAAFAIGGTPELRKARKTEKVLQAAQKAAPATGDELGDQMEFYRKAQNAAIDAELPEIAMQATEKLSQLRLMQEERSRLKSAEGRAVAKEAREAEGFLLDKDLAQYELDIARHGVLLDPETREVIANVDMKDAASIQAAQQALKENDSLKFQPMQDYLSDDLTWQIANLKLKDSVKESRVPSHIATSLTKTYMGYNSFLESVSQLTDIIDEAPEALAAGGKATGAVQKLATHTRSVASEFGNTEENEGIVAEWKKANPAIAENAILQSAIIDLAFALASAREGGKLSTSDIEAAEATIGIKGNPDPGAAMSVLLNVIERRHAPFKNIPFITPIDGDVLYDNWAFLDKRTQEVIEKTKGYKAKYSSGEGMNKKSRTQQAAPPEEVQADLTTVFGEQGP